MNIERIFEVASRISTPLALAGLLAAIFFFVVRQLIAKNIFPVLTKQISGDLLKLIIDRLFILSLVAVVLGFAGFVLTVDHKERVTTAPQQAPVIQTATDCSSNVSGSGNTTSVNCDKTNKK